MPDWFLAPGPADRKDVMKVIQQKAPCRCQQHKGEDVLFGLTFQSDNEGESAVLDNLLAAFEAAAQEAGVKRSETRFEAPSLDTMAKTASTN